MSLPQRYLYPQMYLSSASIREWILILFKTRDSGLDSQTDINIDIQTIQQLQSRMKIEQIVIYISHNSKIIDRDYTYHPNLQSHPNLSVKRITLNRLFILKTILEYSETERNCLIIGSGLGLFEANRDSNSMITKIPIPEQIYIHQTPTVASNNLKTIGQKLNLDLVADSSLMILPFDTISNQIITRAISLSDHIKSYDPHLVTDISLTLVLQEQEIINSNMPSDLLVLSIVSNLRDKLYFEKMSTNINPIKITNSSLIYYPHLDFIDETAVLRSDDNFNLVTVNGLRYFSSHPFQNIYVRGLDETSIGGIYIRQDWNKTLHQQIPSIIHYVDIQDTVMSDLWGNLETEEWTVHLWNRSKLDSYFGKNRWYSIIFNQSENMINREQRFALNLMILETFGGIVIQGPAIPTGNSFAKLLNHRFSYVFEDPFDYHSNANTNPQFIKISTKLMSGPSRDKMSSNLGSAFKYFPGTIPRHQIESSIIYDNLYQKIRSTVDWNEIQTTILSQENVFCYPSYYLGMNFNYDSVLANQAWITNLG